MSDSPPLSIKLSTALPLASLAAVAALFLYDVRAETRLMRKELKEAGIDRFTGSDMDRFIERMQVQEDRHSLEAKTSPFPVPTWRTRR